MIKRPYAGTFHRLACTYAGGEGPDDEGLGDGRSQRGEGAGIGSGTDGGARCDAGGSREHDCRDGHSCGKRGEADEVDQRQHKASGEINMKTSKNNPENA